MAHGPPPCAPPPARAPAPAAASSNAKSAAHSADANASLTPGIPPLLFEFPSVIRTGRPGAQDCRFLKSWAAWRMRPSLRRSSTVKPTLVNAGYLQPGGWKNGGFKKAHPRAGAFGRTSGGVRGRAARWLRAHS